MAADSCGQSLVSNAPIYDLSPVIDTTGPSNDFLLAGGHAIRKWSPGASQAKAILSAPEIRISAARLATGPAGDASDSGVSERLFVAGAIDGEDGYLACHQLPQPSPLWSHADMEFAISAMLIVGQRVVVGDDRGNIHAFDSRTGTPLWKNPHHARMVTAVTDMDTETVVTGDWSGKIVVCDAKTGKEVTDFQQHRDRIVALESFSPDSGGPTRLFSASRDGTVRLWYPEQKRLVRFIQLERPVTAMTLVDANHVLAALEPDLTLPSPAPSSSVVLIDMSRAREVSRIEAPLATIRALCKAGENQAIASDGIRQTLLLTIPSSN